MLETNAFIWREKSYAPHTQYLDSTYRWRGDYNNDGHLDVFLRQVEAGTGEGNQNELTLHFGLGEHCGPVNVEILWPNGNIQEIDELDTNSLFEIQFEEQY